MKNFKNLLKTIVFIGFFIQSFAHANSFDEFFSAIRADNVRTLQSLKSRGFDLNTRDANGLPPLYLALREGALRVSDYLLDQPELDLDARSPQDENALMMAALKGHVGAARRLIERGAQVNKPGWTPLHYAASHPGAAGRELVQLLLEHHAYIDAESPNRSTPLMMAAMYGHDGVAELLLEEGADPLVKNQIGLNAIDFAHRAGRPRVAEAIAREIRSRQPRGTW